TRWAPMARLGWRNPSDTLGQTPMRRSSTLEADDYHLPEWFKPSIRFPRGNLVSLQALDFPNRTVGWQAGLTSPEIADLSACGCDFRFAFAVGNKPKRIPNVQEAYRPRLRCHRACRRRCACFRR